MTIHFKKARGRALIDSGAAICVLDEEAFLKLHRDDWKIMQESPQMTVSAASGERLQIIRNIMLNCTLFGHPFKHKFTVVRGLHRTKMIIGYDFMLKHSIGIQDDKLKIADETHDLEKGTDNRKAQTTDIRVMRTEQIPPHSAKIMEFECFARF